MRKFWLWAKNESDNDNSRTMYIDGVIAEDSWFGDEVTPQVFKKELMSGKGNVTIWLNSPGGDVFAAAQIYNLLMEYPGHVTIKIDGIAASAASVVAMAGSEVLMSPVSCLMIHNPSTIAWGDSEEMLRAKALLDEVKESIVNAYELRTNLSRVKLSEMMNDETWMNARKAVELGFADDVLYEETESGNIQNAILFSRQTVTNSILRKLPPSIKDPPKEPQAESLIPQGTPIESLEKRLFLIKQ